MLWIIMPKSVIHRVIVFFYVHDEPGSPPFKCDSTSKSSTLVGLWMKLNEKLNFQKQKKFFINPSGKIPLRVDFEVDFNVDPTLWSSVSHNIWWNSSYKQNQPKPIINLPIQY